MSPGSSTESYPTFARIGLRENPGKNLKQVTCPDRDSNPGHLVSPPDALTVTPQCKIDSIFYLPVGSGGSKIIFYNSASSMCYGKLRKFRILLYIHPWTDRLDTATCTHTLLSTAVHIRTDHVRYTLRYLHCFSVVSCPHSSDSALNGILFIALKLNFNYSSSSPPPPASPKYFPKNLNLCSSLKVRVKSHNHTEQPYRKPEPRSLRASMLAKSYRNACDELS
ncbi:hypothetical protein ANN_04618 [Periplaneta americana]|uniref:Uncharacterized protein n=1 Tax=Periplaneta americana TaxID=6978 RepID=A0ABQ8TAV3_PERAM|nr:hypothetical protein ANN_04618 [Periplaneta americana]